MSKQTGELNPDDPIKGNKPKIKKAKKIWIIEETWFSTWYGKSVVWKHKYKTEQARDQAYDHFVSKTPNYYNVRDVNYKKVNPV